MLFGEQAHHRVRLIAESEILFNYNEHKRKNADKKKMVLTFIIYIMACLGEL